MGAEEIARVLGITFSTEQLKALLDHRLAFQEITNEINAANDLDSILIDPKERILTLTQADRITIYVADKKKGEIFSRFKVGNEVSEIRVPVNNTSLAGHTALSGTLTNVHDAYNEDEIKSTHPELEFDRSWDSKTGYRTSQILTVPIQYEDEILGVLQLINRKQGDVFTSEEELGAEEIAKVLGIAIRNQLRMVRLYPGRGVSPGSREL